MFPIVVGDLIGDASFFVEVPSLIQAIQLVQLHSTN
jgi:hypothetical protein